jgi:hypothetical protein
LRSASIALPCRLCFRSAATPLARSWQHITRIAVDLSSNEQKLTQVRAACAHVRGEGQFRLMRFLFRCAVLLAQFTTALSSQSRPDGFQRVFHDLEQDIIQNIAHTSKFMETTTSDRAIFLSRKARIEDQRKVCPSLLLVVP